MTFTVNDVRACSGGEHIQIDVTVNGGAMRTLERLRSALLAGAVVGNQLDLEDRAWLRMISEVKELTTGTPTPVQVRNALVGKTFEI